MSSDPEKIKSSASETTSLAKEHPEYQALVTKIRSLEADGVSPQSVEYMSEVENFVRAEPDLAEILAKDNQYLQYIITNMSNALDTPEQAEELPTIDSAHRHAFAAAQEMRGWCNKVAIELKNRVDNRLTPLIDESLLRPLYHAAAPLEEGVTSRNTEQVVEGMQRLMRAFSAIEKGYSLGVSEDAESLQKLGFYIKEFGDQAQRLARVYGEVDDPHALEIAHGALHLHNLTKEKLQLLTAMLQALNSH